MKHLLYVASWPVDSLLANDRASQAVRRAHLGDEPATAERGDSASDSLKSPCPGAKRIGRPMRRIGG
jgi:hypothetical protein